MPEEVIKRDGSVSEFDRDKIETAIDKASERDLDSQLITDKVVDQIGDKPKVEDIQDRVESVLVDLGHYKTAKSYILYRQEHREKRNEKESILDGQTDELSKKFSKNALRVLASRYLKKDSEGNIVESPSELFERVATHMVIPDILHDDRVFDKSGNSVRNTLDVDIEEWDISFGGHEINKWTRKSMYNLYWRLNEQRKMKMDLPYLLESINDGEFDEYDKQWQKYYDLMAGQRFLSNSPTLMNAGDELGQLSACLRGDTGIDTLSGTKDIKDIKVGDKVLSDTGKYKKVTEVMERNGDIVELKIAKLPELYITADHPIMTQDGWKEVGDLEPKEDFVKINTQNVNVSQHSIKIEGVVKDGMVYEENNCPGKKKPNGEKTPRLSEQVNPIKYDVGVDKELAWVLGLFVAEGSVAKDKKSNYDIRITSGDKKRAEKVRDILNDRFNLSFYVSENSPSTRDSIWYNTRICNKLLANWLESQFGAGFSNKMIPQWVLNLPESIRESFLKGISDGDGWINDYGVVIIGVSNKRLAWDIFNLASSLGYMPSLNKATMRENSTEQPWKISYGSDVYNHSLHKNSMYLVDNAGRYRVQSVKPMNKTEKVYNLEVEGDHTYTANKVCVHNCFAADVEDDMEDIMDTVKESALIFKSGGGMGVNFNNIRPKGDRVASTSGVASGPISFMKMFDTMTEVVKQGGARRGALMGILEASHPDIQEFIQAKRRGDDLSNFNISVAVDSDFWDALDNDESFELVNPRNGEVTAKVDPESMLDIIAHSTWESADPGMLYLDNINKYNPLREYKGDIRHTNPCFVGGTRILTKSGFKKIGDLAGESVKLVNKDENVVEGKVWSNGKKDVIRLEFEDGREVRCTPDHVFMTENGDEVRASDLLGRTVKRLSGVDNLKVVGIEKAGKEEVFDFSEPETHWGVVEYMVVHNCAELPLYPYQSCNLGSINLESMVEDGEFNWGKFRDTIYTATKFLDNVVDMSEFPLDKIADVTRDSRKIGLGMMGLANALYRMGIKYDSEEGYQFMSKLAESLTFYSMKESVELAKTRGSFPLFDNSSYTRGDIPIDGANDDFAAHKNWNKLSEEIQKYGIRNSKTTTLPPTGSTAMIADTSHGVEPEFSLAYEKNVDVGDFYFSNDVFGDELKERNLYDQDLLEAIADNYGTLRGIDVPDDLKDIFVTALDIHYLDHLMAQGVLQKWIAASISKTINMPADAEPSDVRRAFEVGHDLGVKGLTVYRDKSKSEQVINMKGESQSNKLEPSDYVKESIEE